MFIFGKPLKIYGLRLSVVNLVVMVVLDLLCVALVVFCVRAGLEAILHYHGMMRVLGVMFMFLAVIIGSLIPYLPKSFAEMKVARHEAIYARRMSLGRVKLAAVDFLNAIYREKGIEVPVDLPDGGYIYATFLYEDLFDNGILTLNKKKFGAVYLGDLVSPKYQLNPDAEKVAEIKDKLKETGGYCPCALLKTPETKCPCAKFRDMGKCVCGLYVEKK